MSERVRGLSRDFATFPETRFAAQGPWEGRRTQAATQRPPPPFNMGLPQCTLDLRAGKNP